MTLKCGMVSCIFGLAIIHKIILERLFSVILSRFFLFPGFMFWNYKKIPLWEGIFSFWIRTHLIGIFVLTLKMWIGQWQNAPNKKYMWKTIATNKRLFITCFENLVANQDEILDLIFPHTSFFKEIIILFKNGFFQTYNHESQRKKTWFKLKFKKKAARKYFFFLDIFCPSKTAWG
jgi:hypothetical protein